MLHLNTNILWICLVYYQQQLTMHKQQFHDSGIVDEGLSDETGSVEDGSNDRSGKQFMIYIVL